MIPLATTFRSDGFDFRQIKRTGAVAMFAKRKPHWTRESIEVVIVQERKEHTWPNGMTSPAHEGMPGNEAWGDQGWTFSDLEAANRKFYDLQP